MSQEKVVIIGSGASARIVVKTLRLKEAGKKLHITVVQPNEFASLSWYETLVITEKDPLMANITTEEIKGVDETIYGIAVSCGEGSVAVKLLNNEEIKVIHWDKLVCATGSAYPAVCTTPGQSLEERQKEVDSISSILLSGKNIVLAGGGAVGVELCGDILEASPATKGSVTLICRSDRLVPDMPEKVSEKVKVRLEKLGAQIIFNDQVISHSETTLSSDEPFKLTLRSGAVLECAAYIASYSQGANTSWLTTPLEGMKPLLSTILNERSQVIVDEYLASKEYPSLYALGATNSKGETNLLSNCEKQAKTAAENILSPKSTKDGPPPLSAPFFVLAGHDHAIIVPENLPMPACCSTMCCIWCGYPCNLLCPCVLCGVIGGVCDPMVCGMCCSDPEGAGTAKTLSYFRTSGMLAKNGGYTGVGKSEMQR